MKHQVSGSRRSLSRLVMGAVLVTALSAVLIHAAMAQEPAITGLRLVYADDIRAVKILDQSKKAITPDLGVIVPEGCTIQTGASSLELESTRDRTSFRIAPDTVFSVKVMQSKGGTEFNLANGKIRVIAAKSATGTINLKISTPLAAAGVRGTDFLLSVKPGAKDWICVREGLVEYARRSDNARVNVAGGEYADATYRELRSEKAGPDTLKELFAGMDFKMDKGLPPPPPPQGDGQSPAAPVQPDATGSTTAPAPTSGQKPPAP